MNSTIDEALERMRGVSPELTVGGPNHGPMAAEALVTLGYDDDVLRWVDRYRAKFAPMPSPVTAIAAENWRDALGRPERAGDWTAFFHHQLAEGSWSTVLNSWLPELIPGIMAAGTHGLIRTAHAVRALEDGETHLRVEELAMALGYWAAYYLTLPGQAVLDGTLDVGAALERIPRLGRDYDARAAMPREFIEKLGGLKDFPGAVRALAEPESIPAAINALTETAARLYLANISRSPLVMLHAVTGPSALRLLLPHMPPAIQRSAFTAMWHAVAAWVAAFSVEGAIEPEQSMPALTEAEVVGRCLETGDAHAIKLVEACLREHRSHPSPAYFGVALDWALRLSKAKGWSQEKRVASGLAVPDYRAIRQQAG